MVSISRESLCTRLCIPLLSGKNLIRIDFFFNSMIKCSIRPDCEGLARKTSRKIPHVLDPITRSLQNPTKIPALLFPFGPRRPRVQEWSLAPCESPVTIKSRSLKTLSKGLRSVEPYSEWEVRCSGFFRRKVHRNGKSIFQDGAWPEIPSAKGRHYPILRRNYSLLQFLRSIIN